MRIHLGILVVLSVGFAPSHAFEEPTHYSSTTQKGYVHNARSQINALTTRLGELEAKAKRLDQVAREDCQKTLQDIRRKQRLARQKLEEIRKAPADRWQELRKKEDALLVRLQKSYQHLKNQYFP